LAADVPADIEVSGFTRGESGGEGTLEVHLLVECAMGEAGMRLRWREDDMNSGFSGSKGTEAGGIGKDPINMRDGGCLDIRRRCRSSVGGEEMLGDGLGDFPPSKGGSTPGKLGTGDDLPSGEAAYCPRALDFEGMGSAFVERICERDW
jgi:hypothetical protein